jgi:hypothetical protein
MYLHPAKAASLYIYRKYFIEMPLELGFKIFKASFGRAGVEVFGGRLNPIGR